jgi:hypothetical protein
MLTEKPIINFAVDEALLNRIDDFRFAANPGNNRGITGITSTKRR